MSLTTRDERELPETVIEPRRQGVGATVREAWRYRRLARYFGDRAVDKMVTRTVLGGAWLVIRPTVDIGVKALVFGAVLGISGGSVPYIVFFVVGMSMWRFFDLALLWSTRSIEINRKLVTKLYFPHLLLPVASLMPALIELGVCAVLSAVVFAYYGFVQGEWYVHLEPQLLLVPLALGLVAALAIAIGLWTSVLGASARDVRFSLRYVTDVWFYLTPVLYTFEQLPESIQPIAQFNPLTAVIEMLRYGLLGQGEIHVAGLAATGVLIALVAGFGLRYFSRAEAAAIDHL